jgi:hypothetical protein
MKDVLIFDDVDSSFDAEDARNDVLDSDDAAVVAIDL